MAKCPGLHCDGCGKGTAGGGLALLVVVLVAIVAGSRRTIDHAMADVMTALMLVGIGIGSAVVLSIGSYVGWRLYTARARVRAIESEAPATLRLSAPGSAARPLSVAHRAAIEPPRRNVRALPVVSDSRVPDQYR